MRTIKADEIVEGMRVRFEASNGDATITTEGVVTKATGTYGGALFFGDYGIDLHPDHPVTVLAEPEPEWVEGAWYRLQVNGNETIARRVEAGWVRWGHVSIPSWEDADLGRNITVLARVLIVDWPGDDVARYLSTYILEDDGRSDRLRRASLKVADAIRTQGGVR